MKYKIISLMLIIPFILMLCVFSAANVVSINVPIPVSGVRLFNDLEEHINLAEYNTTLKINAMVEPTNASNKKLIYSFSAVEGKKQAVVEISDDGVITPIEVGTVKITATSGDGAYSSSFILEVTSSLVTDFEIKEVTDKIVVGDVFTLEANAYPLTATHKDVIWTSSNPNVLKVNMYTGKAEALSSGEVEVSATIEDTLKGVMTKRVTLNVMPKITDSGILFNGQNSYSTKTWNEVIDVVMNIGVQDKIEDDVVVDKNNIVWDYNNDQITAIDYELLNRVSGGEVSYKVTFALNSDVTGVINASARLNLDGFENYSSSVHIDKVGDINDVEIIQPEIKDYIQLGGRPSFNIELDPDTDDMVVESDYDEEMISLVNIGNRYQITALKEGSTTLKFDIYVKGALLGSIEKTITIIDPPQTLNFANDATLDYTKQDIIAVGRFKLVDGNDVEDTYKLNFTSDIDLSDIEWTNTNTDVCSISNTGELKVLGDGITTITATHIGSRLLNKTVSTTINLRCVDGVNVNNYNDLVEASEAGRQIVITDNIDLGVKLINVDANGNTSFVEGYTNAQREQILRSEVTEIDTTYEWNYFKYAEGYNNPPKVKYAIKFTNNVHGNGYTLNANNITNITKGDGSLYDFAVFRGPLDLVKLKSDNGVDSASVKAQDNIAFLIDDNVTGESVTINNVELVGANLQGKDSIDLNRLNYVGTTVEVMGDNVNIVNSKIKNGRNVLRVFGGSDPMKKINVNVSNCILSYAREFIVKMGSNAIIKGEFADRATYNLSQGINNNSQIWEDLAPDIDGYKAFNDCVSLTETTESYLNDENFLSLVKTELSISNSVLMTSGLFSIGIESAFAGPALDGGFYNKWNFYNQGWRQIAGTSYPTRLNLNNVKFYDWKKIDNMDSNTLMDGNMFSLDLAGMIEQISNMQGVEEIINTINGEEYVHGGIVAYGGGKSYALVDFSDFGLEKMSNYSLSIRDFNSSLTNLLSYASGIKPFTFYMYNKNSNLSYAQQQLDIANGTAANVGVYEF